MPPSVGSTADLVGRSLLHFQIVARLGAGGMGVVYKAIDRKLRRSVALKVLAPRYLVDERNKELIFREARSAAAVSHPNIAAIHELHDDPSGAFFVMELVEGETLRTRIARSGCVPIEDALRWANQIALALARAHAAGVVHRDLKADNVMIAKDGDIKLLDFGLAKVLNLAEPVARGDAAEAGLAATIPSDERSTEHGRVMGTPAYMSPEQARADSVDARTDVFAFGVVLYEMITGKTPFAQRTGVPSGDPTSDDWKIATPATELAVKLPGSIPAVLDQCLALQREARPANGAALCKLLAQQPANGMTRRRWPWLAAGCAIAIAAAAVGIALRSNDSTRGPRTTAPGYERGLDLVRAQNSGEAISTLLATTTAAPGFAPGWVALARAYKLDFDPGDANIALSYARAVAGDDQSVQLDIEGLQAELDKKFDVAADRYRALRALRPKDLDVAYALGFAQLRTGHIKDVSATVDELKGVEDMRLAYLESLVADRLGDEERSATAAERSLRVARKRHADSFAARVLTQRALPYALLHRFDAAIADLDEAHRYAEEHRDSLVDALQYGARLRVLVERGDREGAEVAGAQAAAARRQTRDRHGLAADLINAAGIAGELGHDEKALDFYKEAFVVLREEQDLNFLAHALANYGITLYELGRLDEADAALRESIATATKGGYDAIVAMSLGHLGHNNFARGDLKQAESEFREAATVAERAGAAPWAADAYNGLAALRASSGDYVGALREQARAVEVSKPLGEDARAGYQAWYAAYLELHGDHAAALETATAAVAILDKQPGAGDLIAHAALATASASSHRPDAGERFKSAFALIDAKNPNQRALGSILLARAATALGDRERARAILDRAPVHLGWKGLLQAEGRLAK